ncbi:MAG: hypothetical protein OEY14_09780 [Myxococcales bacterium]|nr:hypothetical protein [Myxococcales bacterium]
MSLMHPDLRPQAAHPLLTLSLLGAALLGACSFAEAPEGPSVMNECARADQCVSGVCDAEHAICIEPRSEPMRVGVEVLPASDPGGGTPVRSTFPEIDVASPLGLDLPLQARMTIVGDLRYQGAVVPADLTFVRESRFAAGPSTRTRTSTFAEPTRAEDGSLADFSVGVVAADTYQVEVQPTGEAIRRLPPLQVQVTTGDADLGRIDLTYPESLAEPCAGPTSTGCTLTGQVLSLLPDGTREAEDGLQVRAVEIDSGRTVSSTAITGASSLDLSLLAGAFELVIAPGATPFVFVVTAGEGRPLFPTVSADPALFFPGETPRILVPRLTPVRYVAQVEDGRAQPVGGATIDFSSSDVFDETLQLGGSFRTSAETLAASSLEADAGALDPDAGRFEVDLLPGTYDVVITPSGDDLGIFVGRLVVVPSDTPVNGMVFVVPDRSRLGGSIETEDARPVAGAMVRATPLTNHLERPESQHNRTSEAQTDATGRFDLPLDVGCYDLTIRPLEGTAFPWIVAPDLRFVDADVIYEDHFRVLLPVPLEGTVTSPDGAPMAGAEIRAYAILEGDTAQPRTVQIGEAISGEDGRYLLLLPPRLQ